MNFQQFMKPYLRMIKTLTLSTIFAMPNATPVLEVPGKLRVYQDSYYECTFVYDDAMYEVTYNRLINCRDEAMTGGWVSTTRNLGD